MMRSYSELITIPTFIDRYRYLRLDGKVGLETFGWERRLNQDFYRSKEWRDFRNYCITRDLGRDLGVEGFDIPSHIIIHHLNPMEPKDIRDHNLNLILNPENAICCSDNTHNAIHYGDESLLIIEPVFRYPGDTTLWRR